jgi:ABC-type glycerol-3-phosphate transport system substrate-binding protein
VAPFGKRFGWKRFRWLKGCGSHARRRRRLVSNENILEREISRRSLIKIGGLFATAAAMAPVIAACQPAATATSSPVASALASLAPSIAPAASPSASASASSAAKVDTGVVRWRGDVHYQPSIEKVVSQLKIDKPNLDVQFTAIDANAIGETWQKSAIESGQVDLLDGKSPKFLYLDPLVQQKLLTPLDDYYDLYGWEKVLDPATVKHSMRDGHVWMVPFYLELPGIAYRPSSLAKANLTAPPATWAEFTDYLTAMKNEGVIPLTVAGRGFSFIMLLHNMLWASTDAQSIKNVIFGDGKWTDGPAEAAAAAMLELQSKGLIDADALSIDIPASTDRFLTGKAATNVTGTWFFATMQSTFGGEDWSLFTPPSPAGGPMWSLGEDQSMVFANNIKDPNAAAAVIDYAVAGGGAKVYTELGNLMNTSASAQYEIPQVQAIRKEFSAGNNAVYLFGWLPAATLDAWQSGIGDVLAGRTTPADWTANVQKAWETDIAQGNVPADRAALVS